MPLNGASWGKWGQRLHTYLAGEDFDELAPVGGGASVPFVHDEEAKGAQATEGGLVTEGLLVVYTRTRLAIGARYTWSSTTWQVASCEQNRGAGADWNHRVELVRHAA